MTSQIASSPDPEGFDAALLQAVAGDLEARDPLPAEQRDRLFARIESAIGFGDAHRFVPAQGGDWRVLAEGVYLKVLQRDETTRVATYLVRYSPGTSFPRHPQRTVEECMLVAGDLRIGDTQMRPGDLQIAVPGVEHGPLVSRDGALVFVRGVLNAVPERRQAHVDPLPG